MKPKIIYITGFRQHAGKTVTSIGLLSLLRKYIDPEMLGYIKPVGQELVTLFDGSRIDKDAVIIKKFSGIEDIDAKTISPVRLGSGFTKKFLDTPDKEAEASGLRQNVVDAFAAMAHKRIIIAEGTGHPGVGGIVDLSNAQVANHIDADIIFLSGGGIGKALDQLEVDLSYFMYKGCKVKGLLFNKIYPKKMEQVKHYISEELIQERFRCFPTPLRILGYLPEIKGLNNPSMKVIMEQFTGAISFGNLEQERWYDPCNATKIISLREEDLRLDLYLKPHDIVLIGSGSYRRICKVLEYNESLPYEKRIGGIILTCGETTPYDSLTEKALLESNVPTLFVKEDTAKAESMILKIFENTKIQTFDTKKIAEVAKLFEEHFEFERFIDTYGLQDLLV